MSMDLLTCSARIYCQSRLPTDCSLGVYTRRMFLFHLHLNGRDLAFSLTCRPKWTDPTWSFDVSEFSGKFRCSLCISIIETSFCTRRASSHALITFAQTFAERNEMIFARSAPLHKVKTKFSSFSNIPHVLRRLYNILATFLSDIPC